MIRDPERVHLRKAGRAALVSTSLFAALAAGFDEPTVAIYASFASFAALVFCDFGGPLAGRARAYGGVLVVGAALVALGSACSRTTTVATVVMAIVGFVVVFVGALGGYVSASGVTLILAFVLAVMVPGPDSQIGQRELGWCLGVLGAAVAALVLWPAQERRRAHDAVARLAEVV